MPEDARPGGNIGLLDNDGVGYAAGNITLSSDIAAEVKNVGDQIKAGTITVPTTVQK